MKKKTEHIAPYVVETVFNVTTREMHQKIDDVMSSINSNSSNPICAPAIIQFYVKHFNRLERRSEKGYEPFHVN